MVLESHGAIGIMYLSTTLRSESSKCTTVITFTLPRVDLQEEFGIPRGYRNHVPEFESHGAIGIMYLSTTLRAEYSKSTTVITFTLPRVEPHEEVVSYVPTLILYPSSTIRS